MTHTIYGIRLRGEPEVRYVGMTYMKLKIRLRQHRTGANVACLSPWITKNADRVEIFPIAKFECREAAKVAEKVTIALCARLDHRLFNRANNPMWKAA